MVGSNTRRLLMVVYQFPPYGSVGGSIRATKFAKYLPEFGWEPTVLTIRISENDYIRKESGTLLSDISPSLRILRVPAIHPPQRLVRLARGSPGTAAKRSPRWKRVVRWVFRGMQRFAERHLLTYDVITLWVPIALWHIRKELGRFSYDAIFVTMPPRSMILVAWLAKRLFRKPVILDVRDDWVDTPPFRQKNRLHQAIGRWVERQTVRDVDRVVVVSPVSEEDFKRRYPHDANSIRMIPNGCDLAELKLISQRVRSSVRDRLRMVHAGVVMPPTRDPRPFFEALLLLRETHPDVYAKLDILFLGTLPVDIRKVIEQWRLNDVIRSMDYLPREKFWDTVRNADVLLTIGDNDFPSMVPGKIYDYWAARRPQLYIGPKGAASAIIEENHIGWVASYDVEAIRQNIEKVYQLWQKGALPDVPTDGLILYDRRHLTELLATELNTILLQSCR